MRMIDVLVNVSFADDVLSHPNCVGNEHNLGLLGPLKNRQWSEDDFFKFISDNLLYAAATPVELEAAIDSELKIRKAARRIRICEGKSKASELAEICLYGVMREYYHALPAIAKIFHKQNVNDPVKGADSVHVVLEGDGRFSLWYGEAKFYKQLNDASIKIIVGSVGEILDSRKMTKENELILNAYDLRGHVKDESLYNKIVALLRCDGLTSELSAILHIPILLLHECSALSDDCQLTDGMRGQIRTTMRAFAEEYFKEQITTLSFVPLYSAIQFHLILFPVPNKTKIADRFNTDVELMRS